jgi:hypothetical protein
MRATTRCRPRYASSSLQHLVELVRDLQRRLAGIDRELGELAREHPAARRLATIPGVGPITATALVVAIGDVGRFRSGRHLAAYLGLVPKQHSSGGKERLGTISKRGDTYARTLLAHGARAVVRWFLRTHPEPDEGWMRAGWGGCCSAGRSAWRSWPRPTRRPGSPLGGLLAAGLRHRIERLLALDGPC